MPWLQSLDESLFRFINHSLSNHLFDEVMPWVSGNPIFFPLVLVVAAALVWRGRGQAVLFLLVLGVAVAVTDGLVCNTLKNALARVRPCDALENVRLLLGCGNSGSMPSSHAANWFAATMVAFLFQHRIWRVLLPLAVAVGFSRIYNGVHYPSDVVAGAILGAGTGFAVVFGLNATWRWAGPKWFPLWQKQLPSLIPGSPTTPNPNDNLEPETWNPELDLHWLRAGYVLIAVLTIARWIYVASSLIELTEDEAYQWVWSKHLALSYFSKPPLIAYTQWLGTTIWGDTEFGVRFFSPLIAGIIGLLVLRFFAREVNARAGFFLVVILTATPLLAVGSTLLTVDPLAVLFWTAAMLSGWRAVQENSHTSAWLWTGLWMGLGFLSKYTSPLQWMCWVVFFLLCPAARHQLRRPGPYLALAVNLLCTLPVLVWNSRHDWITVKHVAMHAGAGKPWSPTLRYFGEFLGLEFLLLNPWFFTATLIALVACWRTSRHDRRMVYFFSMGAPVFLLYMLLALKSRVQPNWIAPAILPMFCVMVFYWEARLRNGARFVKLWLASGLGFGLVLVTLMHETSLIGKVVGYPLPPKVDPLARARGYRQLARVVGGARERLATAGPSVFLIGEHYGYTSLLNFYLPGARERVKDAPLVFCQPADKAKNQYYFWPGYAASHRGQNALFVREVKSPALVSGWFPKWLNGEKNLLAEQPRTGSAPEFLTRQFETVTNTGLHEALYKGRIFHTVEIFECRNLR